MHLITDVCINTGLSVDDIRLILMTTREDWETCKEITEAEYQLILQSSTAKISESTEITPVEDMPIETQQKLVDSASQVLNLPLVLAVAQEIKAIDALHQVKNVIALNTIDRRQAELDAAIRERSQARQQAYITALEDLAKQMQKPVPVVEEMMSDVKANNAAITSILGNLTKGGIWA